MINAVVAIILLADFMLKLKTITILFFKPLFKKFNRYYDILVNDKKIEPLDVNINNNKISLNIDSLFKNETIKKQVKDLNRN